MPDGGTLTIETRSITDQADQREAFAIKAGPSCCWQ
jgi:hypothetical protein